MEAYSYLYYVVISNINVFSVCRCGWGGGANPLIFYKIKLACDLSVFSSLEPKAQGELIVWDSSRRPSYFKYEYL